MMKEKKSSYFTATWKMLAAVMIGGIAGGVSVVIYELIKKGIDAGIRTINGTIQQYIFPVLIVIAVVTVVVVALLLYLLFSDKIRGKLACILVALIASGGTGNLIDRIFRGSVTDMFDFRLINFAIFNVADIFVTCGAILFIIIFFVSKGEVLQWNSSREKKMKDKD